ncbi:hypothetical protein GCM10010340_60270 [Streptomyces griseoloalbus]|nr:hypothetical protein GCM10010340_60270 [Streptomyces albaduncus]
MLVVVVAGAGFGSYWFQPWKLWQDEIVREALPTAAPSSAPASAPASTSTSSPSIPVPDPRTPASGELISHEHATSGTVRLVRLPDGSQEAAVRHGRPSGAVSRPARSPDRPPPP